MVDACAGFAGTRGWVTENITTSGRASMETGERWHTRLGKNTDIVILYRADTCTGIPACVDWIHHHCDYSPL